MGYLENFTLEDTISAYEKTMEVTGDNGEHCYSPVDEITLNFLKELKAYRDAEEQGLLFRLPCKVGDKVYVIAEEWEDCYLPNSKYYEIYEDTFSLYMFEDVGECVFLTKEEAEQKLAEMKGE